MNRFYITLLFKGAVDVNFGDSWSFLPNSRWYPLNLYPSNNFIVSPPLNLLNLSSLLITEDIDIKLVAIDPTFNSGSVYSTIHSSLTPHFCKILYGRLV